MGNPSTSGAARQDGDGVTFPEVCPQKKKRFDCLMMVMPGTSTVYWEGHKTGGEWG